MNGRIPCFKNKNICNGNAAKRVCKEQGTSTSNANLRPKNSLDETIIEDDFDFNNDDLQNCFLLESQFLDNNKTNTVPQPINDKALPSLPASTSSKSKVSKSSSSFPDFSDLISKNLSQSKSSIGIQFKSNGSNYLHRGKSFENGNSVENDSMKKVNQKISKLEEELLVKQGEVSNLRCELKRKENILETERIERCIFIDEAECKGKEKGEKAVVEINLKMKKLSQELERAKSDVLFKNREIEELTSKQKKMKFQGTLNNSQLHIVTKEYNRMSPSQKKNSNFSANFDFGPAKPKVKDAAVQTSCNEYERKKRIFLNLKSSSKDFIIPKQYLCVNKLSLQSSSRKPEALSEIIDTSTSFACKRLEKIRIQCNDGSTPWCKAGLAVNKWYKNNCLTHIKFLSRLKCYKDVESQNACLTEVLKHVLPISCQNHIINDANQMDIIETLSNLIKCSSSIPDVLVCNILDVTKTVMSSPHNKDVLLAILSLLVTFSSCNEIKCQMCWKYGSCILSKFFNRLEDISDWGYSLGRVCCDFIKLTSELLKDPPNWLINVECTCPTLLFNNMALYLHSQTKSLSEKSELWPLLISYVRLVYDWAMINPLWWEANESYPACRVFLNNLWEHISGHVNHMDQYSSNLLKQLL